ncbi:response regulator transcription factor [Nocardioides islandensis]|jgi:DNA-binding NarL/FixJ family response regulator|uniref:Response regulator transcription factor n=1 Tax=Nocardioides islandensis TaxID=433663 RepID=A0A930VFE2_9ACTN|nr:response regulator transcription factor [Nocardioides islandensis]MBF4763928.1 response regulator transcription factor [Nocardioides islandensis]
MDTIRVMIVDDHPTFVQGLQFVVSTTESIAVVTVAENGAEAVEQAAELQPDVILMDLHMPVMNGIDATAQIKATSPNIAILVLTMLEDDDSVFAAMRAGASGYLLKGADKDEIVRAIQAVFAGEMIFGPGIAQRVMRYFQSQPTQHEADPSAAFPQLTERERQLLGLIAAGHDNSTIASELVLSRRTVRNHISNIFSKLQVAHRAQAIVMAREAGLGTKRGG